MITVQKTPITPDYDAFAPNKMGYHSPEPNLLDSMLIVYELLSKIKKSLYGNKKSPVKGLILAERTGLEPVHGFKAMTD